MATDCAGVLRLSLSENSRLKRLFCKSLFPMCIDSSLSRFYRFRGLLFAIPSHQFSQIGAHILVDEPIETKKSSLRFGRRCR